MAFARSTELMHLGAMRQIAALLIAGCAWFGEACTTLKIEAGLPAARGDYVAVAQRHSKPLFLGPRGAELRYELKAADTGSAEDAGAAAWLKDDGWFLVLGATHVYGLATKKNAAELASLSGWKVNGSGVAPLKVTCTTCVDAPSWASGQDCTSSGATAAQGCAAEGWTCEAYGSKGWCSNGAPAAGLSAKFGDANNFPEKNCCACGGRWAVTAEEAMKELNRSQQTELQLEVAIAEMRKRLGKAELALVAAAGNISAVRRKKLPEVQTAIMNTEHDLHNTSRIMSFTKASAKQESTAAQTLATRFDEVAKSTNSTLAVIQQVATPEVLAKLELLNRQIWAAYEPEGPASVEVAEKRSAQMAADAAALLKTEDEAAEVVLAKRLRGGARRTHRAWHRLSSVVAQR